MDNNIVYKTLLYDFYGELLTDKQNSIADLYYNNDLSLSEISERTGVSRQGIYDTLKRADIALEDYEKHLKSVQKFLEQKYLISEANTLIDDILSLGINSLDDIKVKLLDLKTIIEKFL